MTKMNKLFDNPWVYRVVALIMAVLLFTYVNIDKVSSTRQGSDQNAILANKTVTKSVPLQINADLDKYFVTGYPEKVKITLEGSSSLVTATVNMQNFKVVADLTGLKEGTHTVELKAEGLSNDLTYSISPSKVTVKIEKKETKKFTINPVFNKNSLAEGYTAGTPVLSQKTVSVTAAASTIDKISKVIASVVVKNGVSKDIDQDVTVQAVDSNGNALTVVYDPTTVNVKIPITSPSKQVAVKLKQTGTGASGKTYNLQSSTSHVTLSGPQSALDKVDSLTANVDISGISKSTTNQVTLELPEGITAISTATIQVTITVATNDTSSESSSTATESSSSSSSSESSSSASSESSADSSSAEE